MSVWVHGSAVRWISKSTEIFLIDQEICIFCNSNMRKGSNEEFHVHGRSFAPNPLPISLLPTMEIPLRKDKYSIY